MPTPNLVLPASHFTPTEVKWLWLYRVALGKLTLFEGDPGLGKSLVVLDLCARLSTGRPLPDGSASPGPCQTIFFSAEDSPQDTVRPRLQALGADLDQVLLYNLEDAAAAGFALPSHLDLLDSTLQDTNARLVVLDPITAFVDPNVACNNEQSVRRLLTPLTNLAARHRVAIILLRHLNKMIAQLALYRGTGSVGWIAACRSAWLFARDPEHSPLGDPFVVPPSGGKPANQSPAPQPSPADPFVVPPSGGKRVNESPASQPSPGDPFVVPPSGGKRVNESPAPQPSPADPFVVPPSGGKPAELSLCLPFSPSHFPPLRCIIAQLKNNLAPPQPSLTYELSTNPDLSPSLAWLGTSPLLADELRLPRTSSTPARDRAHVLLKEYLKDGPRTAREIWSWADDFGLSEQTLKRAKKHLRIRSQLVCDGPRRQWYWLLHDQDLPSADSPDDPNSIDQWLKLLREQFPPSTPLDDT